MKRAALAGATAAALLAFAANSWLCRAALRSAAIDPASFTALRLPAGAATLLAVARVRDKRALTALAPTRGAVASALALFAYAAAFSLAYLALDAGLGALVLFGAVQLTMFAGGVAAGRRPSAGETCGMLVALSGLALLGLPGRSAPPAAPVLSMAAAGVAWGVYSLRGRRERSSPLVANARNFALAVPFALVLLAPAALSGGGAFAFALHATPRGLVLALVSGAVTSGLGYAIWYAALPALSPAAAGVVQLAVPIVAAAGGVALFGESFTLRLAVAGGLVLAGLALALFGPRGAAIR